MELALQRLGWNLNASGLEQCVAECPSKGVEHDVKEVIRVAINLDLREVGKPVLPEFVRHNGTGELCGPMIVQIQRIKNVAVPSAKQHNDTVPKRLLRLQLTDGHTHCSAIEIDSPISGMSPSTPPGTKLKITSKVQVVSGFMLLTPGSVQVCGGVVEHMVKKWNLQKVSAESIQRDRVGDSSGPPPFVPLEKAAASAKPLTKSSTKFQHTTHPPIGKHSSGGALERESGKLTAQGGSTKPSQQQSKPERRERGESRPFKISEGSQKHPEHVRVVPQAKEASRSVHASSRQIAPFRTEKRNDKAQHESKEYSRRTSAVLETSGKGSEYDRRQHSGKEHSSTTSVHGRAGNVDGSVAVGGAYDRKHVKEYPAKKTVLGYGGYGSHDDTTPRSHARTHRDLVDRVTDQLSASLSLKANQLTGQEHKPVHHSDRGERSGFEQRERGRGRRHFGQQSRRSERTLDLSDWIETRTVGNKGREGGGGGGREGAGGGGRREEAGGRGAEGGGRREGAGERGGGRREGAGGGEEAREEARGRGGGGREEAGGRGVEGGGGRREGPGERGGGRRGAGGAGGRGGDGREEAGGRGGKGGRRGHMARGYQEQREDFSDWEIRDQEQRHGQPLTQSEPPMPGQYQWDKITSKSSVPFSAKPSSNH